MLISYKNDPKLKKMLVEETIKHRKADRMIKGTYGKETDDFKGCAVGCAIHTLNQNLGKNYSTSNHSVYETELGIPEWLARLEDTIFEGLPVAESQTWPERFAEAIPVGADLNPVKWKFCAFILKENIERVLTLDISEDLKKQVSDSIRGVLKLHEEATISGIWNELAAESARSVARSVAWSVELAVESARSARSAELVAELAYVKYSEELLRLLREAMTKKDV